jgi:hypothetical protein
MQMDREDYELLKRIKASERVFSRKDGQPYEEFEREVALLARDRGSDRGGGRRGDAGEREPAA